jgi:hypothetical protein
VRAFVTVLAPAPLIFLARFLVLSPIAELLRPAPAVHAASAPPGRTPVVVVIFDELPAISLMGPGRRLDAARYPGFARLARESTWYRNATTVSDSTTRAAQRSSRGGGSSETRALATSRTYPRSVFTLLGGRWDQHVVEPITDVCPPDVCRAGAHAGTRSRMAALASDLSIVSGHLLPPAEIARSLPPIDRGWADFAGTERDLSRKLGRDRAPARPRHELVGPARGRGGGIAATGARHTAPPLHVIHVVAPHVPWWRRARPDRGCVGMTFGPQVGHGP